MYGRNGSFFEEIYSYNPFAVVMFPICNCIVWATINVSVVEVPIHLKMRYGNAQFLYKGIGYAACGSSEEWQEYNYYWTSDGLDTVKEHYAEYLPAFTNNFDSGLLKTQFDSHSSLPIPLLTPPETDLYSITYVKLSKSEGLDLSQKLRPGWCPSNRYDYGRQYEQLKSLNDFLLNPPANGTIIIYSYYVWVP